MKFEFTLQNFFSEGRTLSFPRSSTSKKLQANPHWLLSAFLEIASVMRCVSIWNYQKRNEHFNFKSEYRKKCKEPQVEVTSYYVEDYACV